MAAAAVAAEPEMQVVEVDLGDRTYPIYIGRGLLEQGQLLRKHIPGKTALIVTNETIAPLYLDRCAAWAAAALQGRGAVPVHWCIPFTVPTPPVAAGAWRR